jgi:hypothetical protein
MSYQGRPFGKAAPKEEVEMANTQPGMISISPEQLQDLLKTAIAEAVGQATKLNPIEQRKLDEELQKDRRRNMMMIQLGKIEEESARQKRDGCSHMRHPAGAGKLAGHSAPRGSLGAEWCTGGQAYQDGTAMIICLRCSSTWLFRPDSNYYNAILQNGLLGEAPPPDAQTICPGCFELKPACRCKELYLISKADQAVSDAIHGVAA